MVNRDFFIPKPTCGTRDRRRTLASILLALFVAGMSACVHRTSASPGEEDDAAALIGPVPLLVENRSQYHVTVYVFRGSLRQRVGAVAGNTRVEMTVPDMFTNDRGGLAVEVLQLAGPQAFVSDAVTPQRGERLVLTVQVRLATSMLVVE
jgi:hypothetical protein